MRTSDFTHFWSRNLGFLKPFPQSCQDFVAPLGREVLRVIGLAFGSLESSRGLL